MVSGPAAAWPAGCRDNGSGGKRPRAPAPAIAGVPVSASWLAWSRPARRDAQRHADRGRVRVIQPDPVAGPQISAVFFQLGDHAHRERDGRRGSARATSPRSCRSQFPARIRRPPRTTHTCARICGSPGLPASGSSRTSTSLPCACNSSRRRWRARNPAPGWPSSDVMSSHSPSCDGICPASVKTLTSSSPSASSGMPGICACGWCLPGPRAWGTGSHDHSPPGVADGMALHAPDETRPGRATAWRWRAASTISAPLRPGCQVRPRQPAARRRGPGAVTRGAWQPAAHDRGTAAGRPAPARCARRERRDESELIEVTFSPAEPQLTPGAARAVLAMLLRARERADRAEGRTHLKPAAESRYHGGPGTPRAGPARPVTCRHGPAPDEQAHGKENR